MAAVDPNVINTALAGFVAGIESGRSISDTVAADYSAVVAAGVVYATALEAAINPPIPPILAAPAPVSVSAAQMVLIAALSQGYFIGRTISGTPADLDPATYAPAIAAILAIYNETSASFLPVP